jgi:serine/threonine protein kinase
MLEVAGDPGERFERVKILDFGVVKILADAAGVFGWEKLTQTGVTFGTPHYMAPEQALARPVDGRADLYSLGVILYEMLTGRPPFHSDSSVELLRMHVSREPPPLAGADWYTDALGRLVSRALQKRATARFADARTMIAALDEAFVSLDHLR